MVLPLSEVEEVLRVCVSVVAAAGVAGGATGAGEGEATDGVKFIDDNRFWSVDNWKAESGGIRKRSNVKSRVWNTIRESKYP